MFRENNRKISKLAKFVKVSVIGLSVLIAFNVMANNVIEVDSTETAIMPSMLAHTGGQYVPVSNVSEHLAQVVFYRALYSNDVEVGVSNVYVDQEFQGALRDGEFTVFCVEPGKHIIEAYMDDAPKYKGKYRPESHVEFTGGKTYFIETNRAPEAGIPVTVDRLQAENKLFGYKGGKTINRASAVRVCEYQEGAPLGNILFSFAGKNISDIEVGGGGIIKGMVENIIKLPANTQVNIVGHADPVGNQVFNQKLSVQRAETVKDILISYGVSPSMLFATGQGANNPTVDCTGLLANERNYCNRANRRVDIMFKSEVSFVGKREKTTLGLF
ncbi:OmpA family protein [Budviciaceae bacterium BWR-B9]|uniref:OmpA family protein n=1 Tax=Limnobaculum allomyrinae TaxID=2791986 RepID=A0ABS1IV09_9GAMM|nr:MULTISPECIES: OmpA family protein [Limnobaculum]MBK5145604.1 OmpA family protein [Limnobaculum allomyrinae]MBV7693723.1 OmpA family protein [Limnobaculum sp. M2-1]